MADIPAQSGQPASYNEKDVKYTNPPAGGLEDEEEDADMDALIEELESQDGHVEEEEEETEDATGAVRQVPDDMLRTSTVTGLTTDEVLARRKKYGLNAMKEERVSDPAPKSWKPTECSC